MSNTIKLIAMLIIVWVWLPTGPSDFLFIPYIVRQIGWTWYIVISAGLLYWVYRTMKGNNIVDKISHVGKELKGLFK